MKIGKSRRPYCLVLSGGGAKGVYHIGVWKALKEMGIEVEAFVGASIGAVLAAFFAQGSDEDLESLGLSLGIDSIVEIPDGIAEEGLLRLVPHTLDAAAEFLLSAVEHKGLDTRPMRSLLESKLDEGLIRASGKDVGMVMVNLSDLRPVELYLDQMEHGRLLDYIMASAAFPGFTPPEIGGKKFVDGGLYDNIPYAMAKKRGYRRIIVSDMSGAGRNRRPDIEGTETVYIKNSLDMGGIFDFDKTFLRRFSLLGYLDALRTFGALEGQLYFVQPERKPGAVLDASELSDPLAIREILPDRMRLEKNLLLARMECAASILEVERIRKYGYPELLAEIGKKRDAEEEKIRSHLKDAKDSPAAFVKALRQTIADKDFERCPYFYWRLAQELLPKSAGRVARRALSAIFQELPAGMEFLERRYHAE